METLHCDMREDCASPVSHIGEKGYVYCAACAQLRGYRERCRRLRAFELTLLAAGTPLPSYAPLSKAETLQRVAPYVPGVTPDRRRMQIQGYGYYGLDRRA